MKGETTDKFKSNSVDQELEDYIRHEMHKSIISTTGIPKTFSKPKNVAIRIPEERNIISMSSRIMNNASKSTNHLQIKRSRSFIIKQANLLAHKETKMIEKLTIPWDKQYYDRISINPGFLFFDCLIKAPRGDISQLEINIPESLYYTDKMYLLHTLPNNKIECSTNIFCYKFMKIVESFRNYDEKSIYNKIGGILRTRTDDINNMNKIVLD